MTSQSARQNRPVRRSMVLVPGHKQDWLAKAQNFVADVLVLDLQDSVPLDPAAKTTARQQVTQLLQSGDCRARELSVRVNGVMTPWVLDDLRLAVQYGAGSITLPEIRHLRDLHFVEGLLAHVAMERERPVPAILLEVETAELLCRLEQIADQSEHVNGLCAAPFDFALSTEAQVPLPGTPGAATDDHMAWLRPKLVAVARAHGWTATDAVVVRDPRDLGLVEAAARASRRAGFDGCAVMHPTHLDTINAAFSPSADELAWARSVLADTGKVSRQHRSLAERLLQDELRMAATPSR